MSEAALLAHVVSQVESNIQFLVSQKYISQVDASAFLSKLPDAPRSSVSPPNSFESSVPISSSLISPPVAGVLRARALWAYNETGADPDDLSFSAGDIIEIVKEENGDWWMGRFNGRQALFPAAYVEKIAGTTPPPATRAPSSKPYRPFGAAHHGRDVPPPVQPTAPVPGPTTNSLGLQDDPEQEKKKSKFGKYGNTMAHSAAGGVGFGAGAAIGGGLVRAIF